MAEADSTRRCAHCAARIESSDSRALYCSKLCKGRAAEQKRIRRTNKAGAPPLRTVACCGCGITSRRPVRRDEAGRYCSRKCNTEAMARVAKERAALLRMHDAWAWRPSPQVLAETDALRRIARRKERQYRTTRGCTGCGVPVVGLLNWRRMCAACKERSRRKQVRVWKAARKARIKGRRRESIDPIAVFDRDGWRCYLCGDETPRFLRGTHEPSAPELEHIVAIANGGTHTWDNVACACRSCNQAKGAKLAA